MKQKSNNKSTRRNFLKSSITVAAGTVLGGSLLSSFTKGATQESGEKTKLMTTDGQLVEVDKSHCHECAATGMEARQGIPNKKMVMVIDLSKCRDARKCVKECQNMHNLPPHKEWDPALPHA